MRHSRTWIRKRTIVGLGVGVLTCALIPTIAMAGHPVVSLSGSTFEIDSDANLTVDHVDNIDWKSVDQEEGADEPTGQSDDSFGQGSKEDTAVPAVVSGSIPNNKSDLLNFGFYLEDNGPTQQFLHLYWQRVQEPTGTTNMDFEFNKRKASGSDLSSNGVTPKRSEDDLLIQYDLSQGGTNPTLWLSRWVTSGSKSQCEAANSTPCWSKKENLSTSNLATGSINQEAITVSEDPLGAMSPRTFGEASVDWDAIAGGDGCTSFGSAYLKSRSSDSFTSALKDFIAPIETDFDTCGSLRWLKHDSTGSLLGGATFQVCQTHSYDPGTQEYTAITPVCRSVTDNSTPDTDSTLGEFQLDDQPLGRYAITETAAPSGYDLVPGTQTVNVTSATVFSAAAAFVNNPDVKVIVITCNTVTERLIDATVDLDVTAGDDRKQTLTSAPQGLTEAQLCGLGGAAYDDLSWGTYQGSVEVPDVEPTFP